jgi:DNA-directed RNA polymerase alpha subunit
MIDIPIWQLNLTIRFANELQEREINATADVYRRKRHIIKTNTFILVSSEHVLVS